MTIVIPEPAENCQDSVRPEQLSYSQALAARALLGLRLPASSPSPPTTSSPSPASPSLATPVTNNTLLTLALAKALPRRPRGEKKPIPEELKDNKYFERRKRNNLAAKKSRDQRKVRESQVCQRATLLEKENAVLRAQVGLEGAVLVLIDQLRYPYLLLARWGLSGTRLGHCVHFSFNEKYQKENRNQLPKNWFVLFSQKINF